MLRSASLLFPFQIDNENNCLKRATTVEDVLLSAIRIFLVTRVGSRPGTNVGSFLPELLLTNIQTNSLTSLASALKEELTDNFSGVNFVSVTLTRSFDGNVSSLILNIKFAARAQQNITDLTMTLPSVFDNNYKNLQTSS